MRVPILKVNFSVEKALASYQTPPAMADEPHICPRGPLRPSPSGQVQPSCNDITAARKHELSCVRRSPRALG
jgi:hypothetical protein